MPYKLWGTLGEGMDGLIPLFSVFSFSFDESLFYLLTLFNVDYKTLAA